MSDQLLIQEPARETPHDLRTEAHNLKPSSETLTNLSAFAISDVNFATGDPPTIPSKSALRIAKTAGKTRLSHEEIKRDSAVAPSTKDGYMEPVGSSNGVADPAQSVPQIIIDQGEDSQQEKKKQVKGLRPQSTVQKSIARPATASPDSRAPPRKQDMVTRPSTARHFTAIDTEIPSSSLADLSALSNLRFSHRGTLLLDDLEANAVYKSIGMPALPARVPTEVRSKAPPEARSEAPAIPAVEAPQTRRKLSTHRLQQFEGSSSRFLSADDVTLSQRVRSMYETGTEQTADQLLRPQSAVARNTKALQTSASDWQVGESSLRPMSRVSAPFRREEHETAGGIEDWEDLSGEDVDRYGFILPIQDDSRDASRNTSSPRPRIQRVSSTLLLASKTPRRKRTVRRSPSNAQSSRSTNNTRTGFRQKASKKSLRTASSVLSGQTGGSQKSMSQSRYRIATNKLPHNRSRRIVDEAGDMLTLPPGLPDIEEEGKNDRIANKIKSKEWSREQKWRKMAKPVDSGPKGGGMTFDFDTRNPKLISRTWKGVPDKWRASAWHAFLSASARRRQIGETDEVLIERYYELQEELSKDDVQIDTDVPRTISDHVMFRRRYRGGQRLLFRVLHAISLYFPDTGYVQGMASIAAMLLNYYDEEQAFIMLVRVWELRGLEALYKTGFEGLMSTLDTFEKEWLAGGEMARKLEELGIASTAYATRWYLTIFNVSVPFAAQLRVWDVFLLLGDGTGATKASAGSGGDAAEHGGVVVDFGGADLDVLHATALALMDATRDILLDSDFENAMKTLTSQIPIRDEDILMRVAKTEWKAKKKRAAA
ncbi:MAG: hypothetical protein M1821_004347 [Bathelium mastoideum]|nr:MAG: hypothetical protein M1821_004347 [Bathelium mastoideum]